MSKNYFCWKKVGFLNILLMNIYEMEKFCIYVG